MMLVNGVLFISLASVVTESMPVLVVGFTCCGLSYVGAVPTNSAFVNAFYRGGEPLYGGTTPS